MDGWRDIKRERQRMKEISGGEMEGEVLMTKQRGQVCQTAANFST